MSCNKESYKGLRFIFLSFLMLPMLPLLQFKKMCVFTYWHLEVELLDQEQSSWQPVLYRRSPWSTQFYFSGMLVPWLFRTTESDSPTLDITLPLEQNWSWTFPQACISRFPNNSTSYWISLRWKKKLFPKRKMSDLASCELPFRWVFYLHFLNLLWVYNALFPF